MGKKAFATGGNHYGRTPVCRRRLSSSGRLHLRVRHGRGCHASRPRSVFPLYLYRESALSDLGQARRPGTPGRHPAWMLYQCQHDARLHARAAGLYRTGRTRDRDARHAGCRAWHRAGGRTAARALRHLRLPWTRARRPPVRYRRRVRADERQCACRRDPAWRHPDRGSSRTPPGPRHAALGPRGAHAASQFRAERTGLDGPGRTRHAGLWRDGPAGGSARTVRQQLGRVAGAGGRASRARAWRAARAPRPCRQC